MGTHTGRSIYDAVGWVRPARVPPPSFLYVVTQQSVATVAIEVRVLWCHSYADCFLRDQPHDLASMLQYPIRWMVVSSTMYCGYHAKLHARTHLVSHFLHFSLVHSGEGSLSNILSSLQVGRLNQDMVAFCHEQLK